MGNHAIVLFRATASAIARVAVLAFSAVACVLLQGCQTEGQNKAIDITGQWRSEIDESVMSIEPSGLFALDIPGERLSIIGTAAIDGSRVSFRNRPETKLCVDDDGVYEIAIVNERMIATVVRDTCPSRVLHMSRPWKRLNTESSPPKNEG